MLTTILNLIQADGGQSADATTTGGSSMMTIMWIVIIVLFVWMLIIKPMKDNKKRQAQIKALEKGSKVITSSGIYGRIKEVKDNAFVIEIAEGVKITVDKSCVYPAQDSETATNNQK